MTPKFHEQYHTWDQTIVFWQGRWHAYTIACKQGGKGPFFAQPSWYHHFATDDLETWEDLGVAWPGNPTLNAGTALVHDGRVWIIGSTSLAFYQFGKVLVPDQRQWLIASDDGHKFEMVNDNLTPPQGYPTARHDNQGRPLYGWRDAALYLEDGTIYCYPVSGGLRWGLNMALVGCAETTSMDGSWRLRPPAFASCDFGEAERVFIYKRGERDYLMVFQCWIAYVPNKKNPPPTHDSLWLARAEHPDGPFHFDRSRPRLKPIGFEYTHDHYGFAFYEGPDGWEGMGWTVSEHKINTAKRWAVDWNKEELRLIGQ